MKQNTKRFSSVIFSLLLLVATLIVYFDLVVPAYGDLQTEKGQQISQQTFLDNERQVVTQVQALVSSYQSQVQGEQSVALALPVGQNIAGALTQIYGIASNDNISVQNIAITNNAPQVQAPAVQNSNGAVAGAASGGNIVKPLGSLSFQVTGAGSYESLKSFLGHIETNIRIFDVKSISIKPAAIALIKGANPNQDFFTYDIMVVAYYQAP